MTTHEQWAAARRWWLVAILGVVLGGAAGWMITSRMATAYEAEAVLIVNQGRTSGVLNYEEILSSQELTTTYAELTTSRTVLEAVIAELGPAAPALEDLQQQVSARAVPDTQLIVVTARAQDPGRAALLANAVANAFPPYVEAAQVSGRGAATGLISTVIVAEEALPPTTPSGPNRATNVSFGALLALLSTAVAVGLVEYTANAWCRLTTSMSSEFPFWVARRRPLCEVWGRRGAARRHGN